MLRFGLICLAGLVGGSVCGIVVLAIGLFGVAQISNVDVSNSLQIGVVFGGGFGVIAFPICYYLFLRAIPLHVSLAYTIPATVVAELLGLFLSPSSVGLFYSTSSVWWLGELVKLYGPGFLGLLLSSIALNRFAARATKLG
jgi:hypothetical protein